MSETYRPPMVPLSVIRTNKRKPHKSYVIHLSICNAVHIICGLIAFGLKFTQYTSVALDNNYIDFRCLNWIHIVTGCAGFFMISKNYGSIAAQSLYCLSIVVGGFTAGFYVDSCIEAYRQYREYRELQAIQDGGSEFDELVGYQIAKVIIAALMATVGITEFFVGIISIVLLNRLASDSLTPTKIQTPSRNMCRMGYVAFMKVIFSAAAIVLGSYMEHKHTVETQK